MTRTAALDVQQQARSATGDAGTMASSGPSRTTRSLFVAVGGLDFAFMALGSLLFPPAG